MIKVLVLTVSDRAFKGIYQDRSGPAVKEVLEAGLHEAEVTCKIVPDDPERIEEVLKSADSADFIITTGGTGIGPRDFTPDVTEKVCDRLIPGISEQLRSESLNQTPNAVLSRGIAGIRGKTIIINFPGSEKGARFCAEQLLPVMIHAKKMLEGEGH
jgi:molybdopterin adenylyltransferase